MTPSSLMFCSNVSACRLRCEMDGLELMKIVRRIWLLCSVLPVVTSAAIAEDRLKVSIGQMDTWVNQAPVLGERAGIFKKHGIALENFATQGSGETLQAVVSNAAQIGVGVGTIG